MILKCVGSGYWMDGYCSRFLPGPNGTACCKMNRFNFIIGRYFFKRNWENDTLITE